MIDKIDIKILKELEKNSRISMEQLGRIIFLSGQATTNRIKKLEELGVIKKYTIDLNQSVIGNNIHILLNIFIKTISHNGYLNFINSYSGNIKHNYKISGDCCYILEGFFSTMEDIDIFLEKLTFHANYKLSIILKDCIKKGE